MEPTAAPKPVLLLDIDGVLSVNWLTYPDAERRDIMQKHMDACLQGFVPARHAPEFFAWACAHFEVRWISSYARGAEPRPLDGPYLEALTDLLTEKTGDAAVDLPRLEQMRSVLAATPSCSWNGPKLAALQHYRQTEGSRPFVWLEDGFDRATQEWATQNGCADSLVFCDANRDPDALQKAMQQLQARLESFPQATPPAPARRIVP